MRDKTLPVQPFLLACRGTVCGFFALERFGSQLGNSPTPWMILK
jgi:hypothetical protein